VRILSGVLLLLAAGLAVWFGPGTPLGAAVYALDPPFLNTLQAGVQRRLSPALWDQGFLPVLEQPAWLVPLALGLLLLLLSVLMRRRRRRHG